MDKILFGLFWIVAVMVVCGCVAEQNEDAAVMGNSLRISLTNISTDKTVYRSSEVVNLSVVIYSNAYLANAAVTAKGVGGRMNEKRILNLSEGLNKVSFTYKLPRCNSCGGIRAGMYNFSGEVRYGNITVKDSLSVNIRQ